MSEKIEGTILKVGTTAKGRKSLEGLALKVRRAEAAKREAWEPVRCAVVSMRTPSYGGRRVG